MVKRENKLSITEDTKLGEIIEMEQFKDVMEDLFSASFITRFIYNRLSLKQLSSLGWNSKSVIYGLERLSDIISSGDKYLYRVYDEVECKKDPKKRKVSLIHFPAEQKENKPSVIVIAGGGYQSVSSVGETYPVTTKLNELGYNAFAFTYRVGGKRLFPAPLDDLAAAIKYLSNNAKETGFDEENYVVMGFSAGGNLTALWGTKNHGYAKYKITKPKALVPAYAPINHKFYGPENPGNAQKKWDKKIKQFIVTMHGKKYTEATLKSFDIDEILDVDYPPCYICCCADDEILSQYNSILLYKTLEIKGIDSELEIGKNGGHGFGLGIGTDVEGWLERAMTFIKKKEIK